MTVVKKPDIDVEKFISGAKAEKSDTGKKVNPKKAKLVKQDNVKPLKRKNIKTEKQEAAKKEKSIVRMTFYMPQDMYVKWEKYKLEKLMSGKKKPSFQGIVESYLNKILG